MQLKKDVILVFAGEKENVPRLPMATLVLASYIRKHGFNPTLVDLRKDEFDISKINWEDILCVGISSMSGLPLLSGIKFSKLVRDRNPKIPIVWGGPHASFFPEQTVEERYVDFVVRNEGEKPFLDILRCLQKNQKFVNVRGITYIKDNKLISNPDGDFENPDELPLPAYDLIEMDGYLKGKGSNISYETSRGCPYRCAFCYVHFFHKHKWRAKSVCKVISDLKEIVEAYNPDEVKFVDDNMFVDKTRVLRIAKGMIDSGFKFRWNTNCRADTLSKFTIGDFKLLKKSGCTYLAIGVESGSEKMLNIIQKDITKNQVRIALKKCLAAGIMPMVSLIVGLPGETKKDISETLDFYDEMVSFDPRTVEINGISIYSPYPGTVMFKKACTLGYKPFTKLEDLAAWQFDEPEYVPWYSKEYRNHLNVISSISRLKYFVHRLKFYPSEYKKEKLGSVTNRVLYEVIAPLFSLDANLRWKFRVFSFAPEWKLFDIARSRFIKGK